MANKVSIITFLIIVTSLRKNYKLEHLQKKVLREYDHFCLSAVVDKTNS